jgi:hypothetical protein
MSPLHQQEGEIQAQRIIEALDDGQNIDLYRVRILGDLLLSEGERLFEEPKHINSRIRFSNCFFEGSVNFAKTVFSRMSASQVLILKVMPFFGLDRLSFKKRQIFLSLIFMEALISVM